MFGALRLLREKAGAGARALRPASTALVNGFSTSAPSSHSQRLARKVAVITGGASGIGKATAAEFVRNGARVIIADVQDELGRAVAAELGGPDGAVRYARCDVTDKAQVAAAVDLAVELHGRLDVMFNNAGISGDLSPRSLGSIDLDEHRRIIESDMNEMVGPVLEAEDVARAALYLASDEAKFVSGQNLVVDGGFTVTKTLNVPEPGR